MKDLLGLIFFGYVLMGFVVFVVKFFSLKSRLRAGFRIFSPIKINDETFKLGLNNMSTDKFKTIVVTHLLSKNSAVFIGFFFSCYGPIMMSKYKIVLSNTIFFVFLILFLSTQYFFHFYAKNKLMELLDEKKLMELKNNGIISKPRIELNTVSRLNKELFIQISIIIVCFIAVVLKIQSLSNISNEAELIVILILIMTNSPLSLLLQANIFSILHFAKDVDKYKKFMQTMQSITSWGIVLCSILFLTHLWIKI